MEVNVKYRKDEGTLLDDPTIYQRLVGSLIYLTTTRPDISFDSLCHLLDTFILRRFNTSSTICGLFFPLGSVLRLVAYSDADWVGCPDTRRSTLGWCMFLGDALISWKCKKHDRMSQSSIEAEYRSMSTACSEVIWLCGLLTELQFP
ncbi:uncharacterized mitochondrial protein AtMg00810-like [Aristolochia californica]|uniref:uncharacterized mitochondrial protein AtMg00810-like n=1 Tax=Aristolochia californica TaxID=171875 RepID=UPI0035E10B01